MDSTTAVYAEGSDIAQMEDADKIGRTRARRIVREAVPGERQVSTSEVWTRAWLNRPYYYAISPHLQYLGRTRIAPTWLHWDQMPLSSLGAGVSTRGRTRSLTPGRLRALRAWQAQQPTPPRSSTPWSLRWMS